jgi:hypothetical protein
LHWPGRHHDENGRGHVTRFANERERICRRKLASKADLCDHTALRKQRERG